MDLITTLFNVRIDSDLYKYGLYDSTLDLSASGYKLETAK